jgi:hypothetical protein
MGALDQGAMCSLRGPRSSRSFEPTAVGWKCVKLPTNSAEDPIFLPICRFTGKESNILFLALASATDYLHVRHEVKLGGDYALTLALVAAVAFYVKAEPPSFIISLARQGRLCEQVANIIAESDIGGGVRAAIASCRRLVDIHHFVNVLRTINSVVLAGEGSSIHQPFAKRFVQYIID